MSDATFKKLAELRVLINECYAIKKEILNEMLTTKLISEVLDRWSIINDTELFLTKKIIQVNDAENMDAVVDSTMIKKLLAKAKAWNVATELY